MQLFHGTKQRFAKFDVTFQGTGEAGEIAACWFTDNFEGARHHALRMNRNPGQALVYRCTLKPGTIIADHSQPLDKQPELRERLFAGLPVSISSNLSAGGYWHILNEPVYKKYKGRVYYKNNRAQPEKDVIQLYRMCGIQGVYDWEGHYTDSHYHGPSIVVFDTDALEIQEVIEVNY